MYHCFLPNPVHLEESLKWRNWTKYTINNGCKIWSLFYSHSWRILEIFLPYDVCRKYNDGADAAVDFVMEMTRCDTIDWYIYTFYNRLGFQ